MKFRKIAIFGLAIALTGTFCAALAACTDKNGYTFEDGTPNADRAAPDEGFRIDGVLDEAAYENISWLEGPVLRPYYTSDGQGVYYDYDVIREQTEKAAQVKMGTYYGENGIYLAYSFKEQPGKVCYVNPARKPYRNSGVELHIGIPASETMTGDETVSRLTVNANGALSVAKTQGDLWMPLYGTKDPANMPYVGLTGNGTRTDENADRTEYTFELFLPWGYFDEVGGEGTAQAMKEGGELVVAPGIVTANNYAGTGQTDREYYVLSARLDDGAWANAQGWYHFGGNGYVGYDINVKEAEHGAVQEWMGYDKAPKNSSLTFVTKAEEGYALKEFRVNGTAIPRDYIRYDMYTSLGAEAEKSVQKAYIRLPKREVTGDLEVEAVFEPLASGTQTLSATVYGADKALLPDTKVTFTRGGEIREGVTDGSGKLTIDGLTPGFYDVSVGNIDYRGILDYIFFSTASNSEIVFEENALPLEGSENISSNYKEVYGRVGSVADGFVFSGFFGFEGAEYDDLVNFTHTVYFISDKAAGEQFGFRFTKWGGYLMLKCEGVEYHFESDRTALDYFKQQKGVHFAFAVDKEGNIGVYIRRSESEWIRLTADKDIRFPVEREIVAVSFGKQDDGDAKHYAVMDAELTIGTSRLDLPVSVTVNGEQPAAGGNVVEGGRIELPSDIALSDEVTITLTPERNYAVQSLKVDGLNVECTEANGAYIYTFTASKQSYAIEASFALAAGDMKIELQLDPSLAGIADDLEVTLSNTAVTWTAVRGEGTVWTAEQLPFGRYVVTVSSKSGGYTVLRDSVICEEEGKAVTLTVSPENYGDERRYELLGENYAESPGVVVGENLGVSKDGFIFDGFLGVGGSGSLKDIGTKNFAAALRFTTESGYQYRVSFYIWNGRSWLVKIFQEGRENTDASREFAVSGKADLMRNVREQNGISLRLMAAKDGTLTVYGRTNATDLVYLGEWKSPFPIDEGIEKVEVLKMFQSGIETWTARVEGVLQYGTSGAEVPVEIEGPENIKGGKITMPKDVKIGDRVTITMEAEEGYDLSLFRVNGSDVTCKGTNGSYSYTFTATRTRYEVEVVFGELDDLTISVGTGEVEYQGDIVISLVNARGQQVGIVADGTTFKAPQILHGEYELTVYSTEGYIVMRGPIVFSDQNRYISVSLTPENYGDSRSYEVSGSTTSESGVTIAEQIGTSDKGFVFEGFLGVGGEGSLAAIGEKNFASGLRITTESGYQYRILFYIWGGDYWLVKVFPEGNEGAAHEFPISDKAELMNYVRAHNGVTLTILAETDDTTRAAGSKLTLYAEMGEGEWMLLGSWDSPFPADEAIARVDVLRMFGGNITGWSAVAEGEFTFEPEDVSFPVTAVVGGETSEAGDVEVETGNIGQEVAIKVTPKGTDYALIGIKVDGELVTPVKDKEGYYVYTFTATKSRYDVEAVFAEVYEYTVSVDTSAVSGAEGDIAVSLVSEATGESFQATNTNGVWTVNIPYGNYKAVVTAVEGGYTVATQDVVFAEGAAEATVTVNADSYGDNRKYELKGGIDNDSGIVIAENLGATKDGYVFTGFLGTGGNGSLKDIGTKNYAAALRFTTESGYQYRLTFYIWEGKYWIVKVFQENQENTAASHEFGFTGNTALIDYVKAENGITVSIVASTDGTLTVYAMTSETEWISLGSWQSPFKIGEGIEKVEVLRMFSGGLEGWTAEVDGTLQFGTTETDIDVTFTGAEQATGGSVKVSDAVLGGKVKITLTPDANYAVGGLKVDGESIALQKNDDGTFFCEFITTKSSYALEAAFEQMHAYTVQATIADGVQAAGDLQVVLTNGSVEYSAVIAAGAESCTIMAPYGDYTLKVTSISGGYTVLTEAVSFAADDAETSVTVNADNYGEMRKYKFGTQEVANGGVNVLAEDLGTTNSFVYSGFMGMESATTQIDGSLQFTAETVLYFENGDKLGMQFICWNSGSGTQEIKLYYNDSISFMVTEGCGGGVHDMMLRDKGVYYTIVMENGTFRVYAKSSDTEWMQLHIWHGSGDCASAETSWASGAPFGTEKIVKVEFKNPSDNKDQAGAKLVDGEVRFGTTETGIPVSFTGAGESDNGTVKVTENITLGKEVTVTVTAKQNFIVSGLKVDGAAVTLTEDIGSYIYTFTATKSSYTLEAAFEQMYAYTVTVSEDGISAGSDLQVVLTNGSMEFVGTPSGSGYTVMAPYGDYKLIVRSVLGGYTVASRKVSFAAGAAGTSVTVNADNYGDNRKYELEGSIGNESGIVIAENLGATKDGYVFTGFLGTDGNGSLKDIGTKNYAAALRFTTESGYQYRLTFYIWNGRFWLVKAFEEGQENTASSHEFAFTGNTALIDYVREKNGLTVSIVASTDGTLTVYAMTSETEWISLGSWQSPFEIDESIEKVEVLRMFKDNIEGWTAEVNGTLQFGTTDTNIPVTFTGTEAVENGSVEVSSANLGGKVIVTLTPAEGYRFKALLVDGTAVTPTAGENGVYTYTFTATKSSHALAAEFEPIPESGTLTVNVQIDPSLPNAENDLTITLTDGTNSYSATQNTLGEWLVNDLPFGDYTLTVASTSGEYTVCTQAVAFTEGAAPVSVSVTPDNYGEMRKYELKGETKSTSGITLAENLGSTKDGFVFSGTFGVAEGESLETIGSNNFASVLRLTTESGYRFTFGFYVWAGNWYIRCYNEDADSNRLEFAIQDTAMKAYMTQANAVDVTLVAKTDGTLTVYVKSGAEEWVSLGTKQHTNFKLGEKIDKVEALRVFNIDLTAMVNGTLQFGTTEIDIPVTLKGSNSVENPGVVISEALSATKDGYVFTGFLGVGGSGSLKDIGTRNYATALRFTTESDYQYRLTFYIWNGKYWLVKAFQEGHENTASSHEFAFTDNTALIDYVKEKNGLTVSIAASADGTLTVYAMTSETEWISLGEWKSPFKIGERIETIEVLRMFSNGIEGWTAVVDGELQLGTTETGIPVTNVLTDTINLDEKGTRYWEHYSSGTGGENGVLMTRSSTGTDDERIRLEFRDMSQGKGDGYETRPDNADNAQAFKSSNGLDSKGFVFRDGSRPLTATVTFQKDDSSLRVYTGTWISNCQFTITLTDSDGNTVGVSAFTVTNGMATYETVFTIDTSSWAEDESRTFTLNMTSNNTLKLMAIAIS